MHPNFFSSEIHKLETTIRDTSETPSEAKTDISRLHAPSLPPPLCFGPFATYRFDMSRGRNKIERLILVYNADWSLRGGLQYAAQRLRGDQDPCALCEITYEGLTENKAWKNCRLRYGLRVDGVYRNQLDAQMAAATEGQHPCVLARIEGKYVRVVESSALETCRDSNDPVDCLADALTTGLENAALAI